MDLDKFKIETLPMTGGCKYQVVIRFTEDEYNAFVRKAEALGYQKNQKGGAAALGYSGFARKIISEALKE